MLWSVRQLAAAVADEVCAVLKKAASAWLNGGKGKLQASSMRTRKSTVKIAMAAEDESAVFCETDDEVP